MDAVDESTLLVTYQLDSADPQGWSEWDEQDGDADVGAGWDHESDPLGLFAKLPSTKDFDPSVRPTLSLHSKDFDAKSFLAQVHPDATFVDLSHGLAHLRANIEQRSEALKVLVQDNFDRFVAVKATNDGVFREMREHVNGPLRPEADYGTAKLRETLGAASAKADQVFMPVLVNNLKATKLRSTLSVFERSKFFFNLPASIKDSVDAGKYDVALKDYRKGKYLMSTRPGKLLALPSATNPDAPDAPAQPGSRLQAQQKRVFDNVWGAVERVMSEMETKLFTQLKDPLRNIDEQIKTIEFLLELETKQDPVLVFLESQRTHVRTQTTKTYDNCTSKIDVARADAAGDLARGNMDKARAQDLAACLRQLRSSDPKFDRRQGGSSWVEIQHFVRAMCNVLLRHLPAAARVLKQYNSGTFFHGSHAGINQRVAARGTAWQKESIVEFCSLLTHYFSLTDSRTAQGAALGPLPDWVPQGGSAFTAGMLMRSTLDELDDTVTELDTIVSPEAGGAQLSSLLANMRYRFTDALCTLWINDAQIMHRLEDWTPDTQPSAAEAGTTLFMRDLASAHRTAARLTFLVAGGKETGSTPKSTTVSPDLAQRIRVAFTDALRASFDGVKLITTEAYEPNETEFGTYASRAVPGSGVTIDVSSGETRLLLSVLNVQYIKDRLLPALLNEVGAALQISFSEVGRTLRSRATAVDAYLFDQYVTQVGTPIRKMLRDGILHSGVDWRTIPPPTGVHPFIYDALLALVQVHAHVRTVTAAGTRSNALESSPGTLVERTLGALLEYLAAETLASFQQVQAFGLGGMLQATLEIEFLHQTMAASVTPKSEATLKSIYHTISERYTRKSPDEAAQLKTELESVKRTLVAARKATALQFLCFRRPRSSHSDSKTGERSTTGSSSKHSHSSHRTTAEGAARSREQRPRERPSTSGSGNGPAVGEDPRPSSRTAVAAAASPRSRSRAGSSRPEA